MTVLFFLLVVKFRYFFCLFVCLFVFCLFVSLLLCIALLVQQCISEFNSMFFVFMFNTMDC